MPSENNDIKIRARLDYTEFKKGMRDINSEYNAQKQYVNALERQIKDTFDIKNINQFDKAIQENEKQIEKLNGKLDESNQELKDMATAGKESTKEFTQLQTEITKMEVELSKAEKRQEKFNQNAEALKTGKYEDLSNDYKKIAKNTEQATDEELKFSTSLGRVNSSAKNLDKTLDSDSTEEYANSLDSGGESAFSMGDALEELTGSSNLANTAVQIGTKVLNPYVGAVALAVAGVNEWAKSEQRVSEAVKTTAGTTADAVTNTKGYTKQVQHLANVYGLEYSEALDISIKQQNLFNSTILDGKKGINDFNKTMALLNLEYIDYEQAVSTINKAQAIGNETTDETIGLLFNANETIQKYGASADDLLDTFIEYGQYYDSFEGFLKASNFALEAGVKDLGTFNDGINEFNTNVREMSTQYQEAMSDIEGASEDLSQNKAFQKYIDDTYKAIDDGSKTASQSFAELIVQLSQMEDTTKSDAIAISLFGDTALEQVKSLIEFEQRTHEVSYALEQQAKHVDDVKARNEALIEVLGVSEQAMSVYNEVVKGSSAGYSAMAQALGLTKQQANQFTAELERGLPYAQDYLESIGIGTPMIGAFSEAFRNGDEALANWGMKVYQGKQVTDFFTQGLQLSEEQSRSFHTALSEGLPSVLAWLETSGKSAEAQALLAEKTGLSKEEISKLVEIMNLATTGHQNEALAIANQTGVLEKLRQKNLITQDTFNTLTTKVNNQKQAMDSLKGVVNKLTAENGLLNKSATELGRQFNLNTNDSRGLAGAFDTLQSKTASLEVKSSALTRALKTIHPELDLNRSESKALSEQFAIVANKELDIDKRSQALKSALQILKNNGFQPTEKGAEIYRKTMDKLDKATNDSSKSLYEQANSSISAKKGLSEAESVAEDSRTTFQNLKADVYNLSDSYDDLASSASNASTQLENAKNSESSGGGFFDFFSSPTPQLAVSRETITPTAQTRQVSNTKNIDSSSHISIDKLIIETKDSDFQNMNSFIKKLKEEVSLRS